MALYWLFMGLMRNIISCKNEHIIMKFTAILTILTVLLLVNPSVSQDKETQIKIAVMAAPKEKQADATVLSVDKYFKTTVLKKGTNEMICLTDDPDKDGINVACYHEGLESFMARGRELKAEGKKFKEIFDIREEEVKSGKLKIPDKTTLHVMTGERYDPETQTVINEYHRWVVYIPYATPESTGLPLKSPGAGGPWLMDAGTHRAHIMLSPPIIK